jgi:hypothetical protein
MTISDAQAEARSCATAELLSGITDELFKYCLMKSRRPMILATLAGPSPYHTGGSGCASQHIQVTDVRFGSKADIAARPPNVRFTPESGHRSRHVYHLRRSNSGNLAIFAAIRRALSDLILIKLPTALLWFKLRLYMRFWAPARY